MVQGTGSLPPPRETRLEFPAPGIAMAQPCLLCAFGEKTNEWKLSLLFK